MNDEAAGLSDAIAEFYDVWNDPGDPLRIAVAARMAAFVLHVDDEQQGFRRV